MATNRKTRPASEAGMVLITVLLLTFLLGIVSMQFMHDGLRSRAEVNFAEHRLRAQEVAETGLARAELELASGQDSDGDGLGSLEGGLGGGHYKVEATDLGSGRYELRVVATHGLARVVLEAGARASQGGLFEYAMFGRDSVKITGGSHTDSYDTQTGTWLSQVTGTDGKGLLYAGAQGHVGSNGLIVTSGPVRGNAIPGVGSYVDHPENVWGSTTPRTEAEVLTPTPFEEFQAAFLNNDNLTINVSNSKVSYDAVKYELLAGGGAPITLNGGTYIFNTLKITGGGSLFINGPCKIYITNYFEISGGGVANLTGIPANCLILAHPYDFPAGSKHDKLYVKTSGGSDTVMAVYAPLMHLEVSGGGTFFGALAGKSVVFSGGSAFHYDEALGRLGGGPAKGIERTYWLQR